MANVMEIAVVAQDKASDALARVGSSGEEAADQVTGGFAGINPVAVAAFAAIAAGIVLVSKKLLDIGGSFDDAFDKIRVGTGATGANLDGLKDDFREVVANVPTDFESAGTAVADLNTRLGLTGKPLQDMSAQFINLSRLTGTDLTSNIASMTRMFGDWNIAAEDQSGSLDKLFRAAQASGMGVDQLSAAVVQSGAPLRNMGFSFEESLALLAKFDKEGVNSATVLSGMKAAVGKLAKAGEDVPTTFKRVVSEIEKLGPGTEATGLAIELFGQRAGPDLADAIAGGKFNIDEMLGAIEGGSDTIQKASDDTADWAESWQILKNKALVKIEPVAVAVFNALGKIMDIISTIVGMTGVAGFFAKLGLTLAVVGTAALVAAPAVVLMAGSIKTLAASTWSAISGTVRMAASIVASTVSFVVHTAAIVAMGVASLVANVATKAWATGQWLLNVAMSMNPIGLVIIAIVALVAAFVIAYKKSETFRKIVIGAWNAIKHATSAVFDWIVAFFKKWGARILIVLGGPIAVVVALIVKHWDKIKAGAVKAFNAVVDFARGIPGKIKSAVGNLGKLLYSAGGDILRGIWNGMQSIAGWLKDKIYGFFKNLLPGWAKKALGIDSGSKVFAMMGRMSGLGLAQGLDASQTMVAIASKRLAKAAATGLTGPAFGGGQLVVSPSVVGGARDSSPDVTRLVAAVDKLLASLGSALLAKGDTFEIAWSTLGTRPNAGEIRRLTDQISQEQAAVQEARNRSR